MRQTLLEFTLGGVGVTLRAYSTFYTLAWIVAPLLAAWVAARRGVPWQRAIAVYASALGVGIVGARVFDLFIAWDFYAEDLTRILSLSFRGFSLYGGLMLATITAIGMAHALKVPLWRLADSSVPGLVAGIVLMRTGCFLNGCCFGTITDVPWAITFPPGSPVWEHQLATGAGGVLGTLLGEVKPVHPTQLYEMLAAVGLGGLAAWLTRRRMPEGVPFLSFAMGFTLFRLANGFLRERQAVITAPEWFYPVFYLSLAAIMAMLIVLRVRQRD